MSAPARRFANIRAVLFDLDGTLIDSAPDLGAAANLMRVQRGLPALAQQCYRPMAGAGARGMIGVAFGLSSDDPAFDALREEFFLNYENNLFEHTTVFAGVPVVLAELSALGLPWGVVTNKSTRFTRPLTAGMPLFASAGAIISGDTTAFAKPHPEPLLEAARQLGVAPSECVYVGDDERDIMAGRAAGMVTVAVSYGYLGSKSDVGLWRADAAINSPTELLHLLASA